MIQSNKLIDESCGFCTEFHDIPADNNLLEHYIIPHTGLESRIITQTEHFLVVPTLGAFVEGYAMVVSRYHYDCMGKLLPELFPELKELLTNVKHHIRKCYGMGTVCFEHGSISSCNRFGGCINHAHIHIVPCKESLIGQLPNYHMDYRQITDLYELQTFAQRGESYLYFEDIDEQQYSISGDFVISQFFRQLLANSHNVSGEWDWRSHLNLEKMSKTYTTLKKSFMEEQSGGHL